MSMNLDPKRLWLEALRSGGYQQGVDALASIMRGHRDEYCCLGVACEVAVMSGVELEKRVSNKDFGVYTYDGMTDSLPYSVASWLGVDVADPTVSTPTGVSRRLSQLNDDGRTFAELANLIEAQL